MQSVESVLYIWKYGYIVEVELASALA